MFMSVDPGYNVGVATFREDGSDISKTEMPLPQFQSFLALTYHEHMRNKEVVHFLYEDFTLRQDKAIAQTGSNMPAPKAIGSLEMVVALMGNLATKHAASSADLRTALKWAGYSDLATKPRNWHCPNHLSAYAHGVMHLIKLGIRKHPIFES